MLNFSIQGLAVLWRACSKDAAKGNAAYRNAAKRNDTCGI